LLASDGFAKFEENCSPKLADPRAIMAAAIAMNKIVRTILIFMAFS
jgi:preprotein translocase subunit Sec61beta